jgi:serine/threonine protein phosphatase 1
MLLKAIENAGGKKIIFVGDYIDKGVDSKKVLDAIINLNSIEKVCLLGNHEQLMLDYLFCNSKNDEHERYAWISNGALTTISSFGFKDANTFKKKLPKKYLDFFLNLKNFHDCTIKTDNIERRIIITHAGLNPLLSLEKQIDIDGYYSLKQFLKHQKLEIENTHLWVRELYLNTYINEWDNIIIIHGHTPTTELKKYLKNYKNNLQSLLFPEVESKNVNIPFFRFNPYKLNHLMSIDIDTGAFNQGRLTAIGFNEIDQIGSSNYRIIQSQLVPERRIYDFEITL